MIVDLLKYIAFLRPQLRVTIDFSVLQAVISWVQEALRSAPVPIPDITRSGALLFHAVAPTSGLGLTDIWSSWRGSVNLHSYPTELEQGIPNEDGYSGSLIHCWSSETRPHALEPLVTGRFAKVAASAGPSPEDDLISTGQVGILRSSIPT